jgi:hypothetical protein
MGCEVTEGEFRDVLLSEKTWEGGEKELAMAAPPLEFTPNFISLISLSTSWGVA